MLDEIAGLHSKKLRIIICGFVSTTHNSLRVVEDIATMDRMLGGRFGGGLVRGYQARWVEIQDPRRAERRRSVDQGHAGRHQ